MASSSEMKLESWQNSWDKNQIGWHKEHVHPTLLRHALSFLNEEKGLKVFVPLCGKTKDMKWFYDCGHEVVGVEISEIAAQQFFQENKLEYVIEDQPKLNGKVYKSADNKIQIYICDLFLFDKSVQGEFDRIYDRGSFEAINVTDRDRYATLMASLMKPGGRHFLLTKEYDKTEYGGPPHSFSDEDIRMVFEEKYAVKLIEGHFEDPENEDLKKRRGISKMVDNVHLLERKS